jgi:hypothetical protein
MICEAYGCGGGGRGVFPAMRTSGESGIHLPQALDLSCGQDHLSLAAVLLDLQ